jgi:hypothetical protein
LLWDILLLIYIEVSLLRHPLYINKKVYAPLGFVSVRHPLALPHHLFIFVIRTGGRVFKIKIHYSKLTIHLSIYFFKGEERVGP